MWLVSKKSRTIKLIVILLIIQAIGFYQMTAANNLADYGKYPYCLFGYESNEKMKTCIIKGNFGKIAPYVLKVFIQYTDGIDNKTKTDSAEKNLDGKYVFNLRFYQPNVAFLQVRIDKEKLRKSGLPIPDGEDRVFSFFTDNASIFITTDSFPLSNSIITGSIADRQSRQLEKMLKPIEETSILLTDSIKNSATKTDLSLIEGLKRKRELLYKSEYDIYAKYLNDKTCWIKTYILRRAWGNLKYAPIKVVENFYKKLNPVIKQNDLAKHIKGFIDFTPGIDAPEFVRTSSENKRISLRDFRGKYVLIDFWGSWCKPCRAENPFLIEVYNKYKSDKLEFIGIAKDGDSGNGISKEEAIQRWLDAINKDKLPWINILYKSEDITQPPLDELYRVISYPTSFLIGPDGKIVAINLRGKELDEKLKQIVKP